jgi:hypothetical protein
MPIPLTPGGDGAAAAPEPASAAPAIPAAAAQQVQVDSVVRPALATALPAWDLMPPHQVLAFRRRA